jgi:hypothetical protein
MVSSLASVAWLEAAVAVAVAINNQVIVFIMFFSHVRGVNGLGLLSGIGPGSFGQLFWPALWQHFTLQNKADNGLQPYPIVKVSRHKWSLAAHHFGITLHDVQGGVRVFGDVDFRATRNHYAQATQRADKHC